jgi:Na+-translocating ferredoxin:NAD+ oxidoreductase RnfG subunit
VSLLSAINNINASQPINQETLVLLQKVFPEAAYYQYKEESDLYTIYNSSENKLGYAYQIRVRGFHDTIAILVGLEDKETIKGISVISHNEAHGGAGEMKGPRLEFTPWDEQFEGLKIENCYLAIPMNKTGKVDAISAATISSEIVTNAVRTSALKKVQYLE